MRDNLYQICTATMNGSNNNKNTTITAKTTRATTITSAAAEVSLRVEAEIAAPPTRGDLHINQWPVRRTLEANLADSHALFPVFSSVFLPRGHSINQHNRKTIVCSASCTTNAAKFKNKNVDVYVRSVVVSASIEKVTGQTKRVKTRWQ